MVFQIEKKCTECGTGFSLFVHARNVHEARDLKVSTTRCPGCVEDEMRMKGENRERKRTS